MSSEDEHQQPGTYAEIRARSKNDVIREYDIRSERMPFHDPNFWLHEVYRRDQEEATEAMLRSTKAMERLTKIITVMTVANVVLTAVAVYVSTV